ncbi:hypothetical protein TREPR_2846 [Treponema primitia ZAS-2]|uniref:Uncharacterized protein n=1 Tax=Treponema primitia (strain ATCC BAA-887 / DSM 12427 / ZAS-2) TaxID=545694 RepID=F5YPU9_TREPZ|nr:hypothetical protein [Treponema primitia]AEF86173.1 hypothetical protein TREPR_2846 [Treponema primitia ZAS-2]
MFDPKISGIAGGIGFLLSILIGIISGAGLGIVFIRAFIFGGAFFILVTIVYAAINMYLPDLLKASNAPGSQIDISIGGGDEGTGSELPDTIGGLGDGLNEFMENPGGSDENMEPFPVNSLDQNGEAGYTGEGNLEELPRSSGPALPAEADFDGDFGDSVDVLPDLDLISGAFTGSGGEKAAAASTGGGASESFGTEAAKPLAGKKGLDGDFNANELASAIQTILKREK